MTREVLVEASNFQLRTKREASIMEGMNPDDCYTAADTIDAMRRCERAMVVFRPSEFFPNQIPPRPLPGWKVVSGDAGTLLYVHIEAQRRAVAWLDSHF